MQTANGVTENARLENPTPSKIQGWKTRNWKTRHQIAGVEIARLENPAAARRGGKRRNKLYGQPMGQFLQFIEITVSLRIVIHICNIISKAIATVSTCRTGRNI